MFYDSIRTRLVDIISSLQRSEFAVHRNHEDGVQITQHVKLDINPMAQNTELAIRTTRCHFMVPSHDKSIINKESQTIHSTMYALPPDSPGPTQCPVAVLSDASLIAFPTCSQRLCLA